MAGISVLEACAPPAPLCCQTRGVASCPSRQTATDRMSVLVSKARSFMQSLIIPCLDNPAMYWPHRILFASLSWANEAPRAQGFLSEVEAALALAAH